MNHRLLVVEDDHELRDVLTRGLREHDFTVITAADGRGALRSMDPPPDAVVLDIGLPDADGRDVCQAMRAGGFTGSVLFLTARGGLTDRLSGFSAGGDDYIAKPFHIAEVVARLNVALRRSGATTALRLSELTLDPATHAVAGPKAQVGLSPIEYRLLARLMGTPNVIVRREELLAAAWAHGSQVSDNTLDQYIAKLRRSFASVTIDHAIETVRGVGYRVT